VLALFTQHAAQREKVRKREKEKERERKREKERERERPQTVGMVCVTAVNVVGRAYNQTCCLAKRACPQGYNFSGRHLTAATTGW